MEADYNEIFRYLGYRGISPDAAVRSEIDGCVEKLQEVMTPVSAVRIFDAAVEGDCVTVGDLSIDSRDFARDMKGCTRCAMLSATIGLGVDRLIKRAELTSMLHASIYQAAGAAFIETYVDIVNDRIYREARQEGYCCRPRFSPGYGDLSLSLQLDFERILEMKKNLGIALTDTLLMIPSKSVTAFVGMFRSDIEEPLAASGHKSCDDCNMSETCEYSLT